MWYLQTDSFYSAMRLLVPQLEKQRAAYGIKEVNTYLVYVHCSVTVVMNGGRVGALVHCGF